MFLCLYSWVKKGMTSFQIWLQTMFGWERQHRAWYVVMQPKLNSVSTICTGQAASTLLRKNKPHQIWEDFIESGGKREREKKQNKNVNKIAKFISFHFPQGKTACTKSNKFNYDMKRLQYIQLRYEKIANVVVPMSVWYDSRFFPRLSFSLFWFGIHKIGENAIQQW